jgi:outer membrane receptor for ferrienterochelin and colicin
MRFAIKLRSTSVFALVVTSSTVFAAGANTSSANVSGDAELTEVVVTGSYLSGQSMQQGTLEVVGSNDIKRSIEPNVAAMLAELPSTQGNMITGGSNDNNNSPAMTINLRGLGTRATLVLLNGQRQVPTSEPNSSSDAFAVDLNGLVPMVTIDRVEVLKDGASAVYGSDAVAGVVNFITRKNLDGIVVQADSGITGNASRKNGRFGFAGGLKTETTSLIAGLEIAHQDQIFTTDIFNDLARVTKFGQTSSFGNPATFFPRGVRTPDPLCGSSTIGGAPVAGLLVGTACRFDLTQLRGMVAETNRGVMYSNFDHKFSDRFTIKAELGAALVKLKRFNSIGFPVNTVAVTVPATNPGNPFGNIAPYALSYRSGAIQTGTRAVTDTSSNTYRARVSAEYQVTDTWMLSFGSSYGYNQSRNSNGGYYNIQRFQDALNCVAGAARNLCFNPFASAYLAAPGSPLYNSPAVLDWITSPLLVSTDYSLMTADALLTGELFKIGNNDPVRAAVGVQRRREATSSQHDLLSRTGGLSFGGASSDYSLRRSVNALFAEVQIPLAPTFDIDVAARMENSSPGGSSVNPKIGFSWKPTAGLTLGGSIGKSQRSPGLLQFTSQSVLGGIINDPVTRATQNGFAVTLLPSTGLKPETSTNANLTLNWRAQLAGGALGVDLDAWNIDFKDLIKATDVSAYIAANPLSPQVVRNPATGEILLVTLPGYGNANKLALSGLDFSLTYSHEIGPGKLGARFGGTVMNKYDFTNSAGVTSSFLGNINTTLPAIAKSVLRLGVDYATETNNVTLTANYKSKLTETTAGLVGISEEKTFTTIDLALQHDFGHSLLINVGVVNLTDAIPPAQGNNIYTTYANAYPLTGRTLSLGLRKEF